MARGFLKRRVPTGLNNASQIPPQEKLWQRIMRERKEREQRAQQRKIERLKQQQEVKRLKEAERPRKQQRQQMNAKRLGKEQEAEELKRQREAEELKKQQRQQTNAERLRKKREAEVMRERQQQEAKRLKEAERPRKQQRQQNANRSIADTIEAEMNGLGIRDREERTRFFEERVKQFEGMPLVVRKRNEVNALLQRMRARMNSTLSPEVRNAISADIEILERQFMNANRLKKAEAQINAIEELLERFGNY